MAIETDFASFLRTERESLLRQIEESKRKVAKIDVLLGAETEEGEFRDSTWTVTEHRSDPFESLRTWPMTATTSMGMCREALQYFGREATAQEIKDLIRRQFKAVPAKTIVEMLYKSASKEKSGIYRSVKEHGPAKYGLLVWRGTDKEDGTRRSFSATDEHLPG